MAAVLIALLLAGGVLIAPHRDTGSVTASDLGPVSVRLDDNLAFVSESGWDARRITDAACRRGPP